MARRRLAIAWTLAVVSQLPTLALAPWVLFAASATSRHGSGDDDDDDDRINPLLACLGLLSGFLTNVGLLCCSLYLEAGTGLILIRIAAISTATLGLSLALLEALLLQQHGGLPASQDSSLVLVCGVLSFFAACAALMSSFYVTDAATAPPRPRVAEERERGIGLGAALYSLDDSDPEAAAIREPLLGREGRDADENGQEESRCAQPTSRPAVDDERPEQPPEGTEEATPRWRGTRRLLQLARSQVVYLYAGCAVLLVRLPFSLSIPHFVSTTLAAVQDRDFDSAAREILYLLVAGSIDAALDFWCVFLFGYANLRIVRGVRLDLFHKLIRQEVGFFDQTSSGELASRLQSDCSEMAGDLTWFFRFSIESVVRIAGITLYMFLRNPVLASCALSVAPVVAVVNKLYGNWLRENAAKVQTALASANSVALEALVNIRTVVAFSAEPYESQRYEEKIQDHYRLNVKQLYMTGVYYMAISTFLINTVVQALLLYIGSRLVQADKLTASVLLAFMLYQGQLQSETLNLFQSYSSLVKSSGAGDKVFQLLDREPPAPSMNSESVQSRLRDPPADAAGGREPSPPFGPGLRAGLAPPAPGRQPCRVELKGVSFTYPSRPSQPVLDDVSLVLPPGRCLAIVGPSGCGKSTICHLLQRFYDPTSGGVLVDGVDLRLLDLAEYRRSLGVVSQEAPLFRGTVLENILYGCPPGASRRDAVEAARMAHADGFVSAFPGGYDTLIGERGVQLSGGQRQRISIARALVRNPSLLLLDEATSALDGASEREVQRALDRLLRERRRATTTVVVAHRLRTVRGADQIAVLRGGRVAELGSHPELMRIPSGLYRAMVERAGASGLLPDDGHPLDGGVGGDDDAASPPAARSPQSPSGIAARGPARKRLRGPPPSPAAGGVVDRDIESTIRELESAERRRSGPSEDGGGGADGGPPGPGGGVGRDGVTGRGLLDAGPFGEYWRRHSHQEMGEEEEASPNAGAAAAAAAAPPGGSRDESVDSVLDATLDSLLGDDEDEAEGEPARAGPSL